MPHGRNEKMISLLVPTRGRPANVERFIRSVGDTAHDLTQVEIVFRADDDDATVIELQKILFLIPKGLAVKLVIGKRLVLSDAWNACCEVAIGDILGFFADDIIFRTPDWDLFVREAFAAIPDGIAFVHGLNGEPWYNERFGTHGWLSRRWVDTIGRFFPPYFGGDCCDTWINNIAEGIGRRVYLPEVFTEHMHPLVGKALFDPTYLEKTPSLRRAYKVFDEKRAERTGEARKLLNVIAAEGSIPKVPGRRNDLVTVIIPCHDQGEYLLEAVTSIVNQFYLRLEVVFACGDAFSEAVALGPASERLSAHGIHSSVLGGLIHGRGEALNKAVSVARGHYIVRLDADDQLSPYAIEKMVNATDPCKDLNIVTCDLEFFGARVGPLAIGDYTYDRILNDNYLVTSSLFTRKLWVAVGGYDPAIVDHEDWVFWLMCSKHYPIVVKVREPLLRYRIHDSQASIFAGRNRAAILAMLRAFLPEIYGSLRPEDVLALAASREELVDKVKQRIEWFPDNVALREVLTLMRPMGG
jgi:glycosyltransferase involved in cell wall biosynthesis